jgi:hypothetical protein
MALKRHLKGYKYFLKCFLLVLIALCFSCGKKTSRDENIVQNESKLPGRFKSYLEPLHEPLFFKKQEDDLRAFRFIWLRTFHNPFIFTLHVKRDSSGLLEVKEGNLKGYHPDSLMLDKSMFIEKSFVSAWEAQVEKLSFWKYNPKDKMLQDGARWILEGSMDTTYHIVNIQSPDSGLYRDMCLDLMKIGKVDLGEIY